ncbi:MAG: hypothetical protein H5T93_02600 [Pseudothermotoga sp.]|uniref:hypothetical protein n=1 Tax=Pseudothermotoga sp. TaxID=2033661 RepID=UPI000EBF1A16|nr:hypothetical protein [Pseudothermotoga sp.]MDK2923396.1 hypothetical protein [Pseudothermotoga sp.]HCO97883.1 hypothetical protein [Pseudothermotoga sp.]
MAFEIEKMDLFNTEVYIVRDRGILYYVGETEPATEDLLLIEEWMRVPVVSLLYDGPGEMRTTVETCVVEAGTLVGVGDLLYVKVRKQSGFCYVRLMYRNWQWDNSDQLWKEEEFENKLREQLKEMFSSQLDRPKVGYHVLVADRIVVEKRENQPVPVKIEVPERIVSLTVDNERKLVSEGFYNFYGRIIYVDEDTNLSTTAFFENARMVYKTSGGYVVYKDGALFFPDGRKVVSPEPFDVVDDRIIPWRVNVRSEGSSFLTTVVGRFGEVLVLSCGMIAPIDLSWFMRVSGPIIEWAKVEERFYVLDIAGYVRAIDLKNRRTLWERLVPNGWGIAVCGNEIYVGSGERLLHFNEKGELVEELSCQDFGTSSKGIITLAKAEGRFVRGQSGSVLLEASKATVYTDQIFEFENVRNVRFFDWGIVLVEESGCWVVEGR